MRSQLAVDSFGTADEAAQGGTVFGEQCTCWTNCTCPGCPSCDHTCGGHSCAGTCGEHTCAGTCGENTCGGYTCDGNCTYWDPTCRNIGTCDGNYWGNCPIVP